MMFMQLPMMSFQKLNMAMWHYFRPILITTAGSSGTKFENPKRLSSAMFLGVTY
jgi:hypothetical protein